METTQKDRDAFRVALNSAFFLDLPATRALLNDADRLAAIETRIRNLIDRKKLHSDRLREEGKGEHCEGFIDALDDEVDDLIAILNPPEGS